MINAQLFKILYVIIIISIGNVRMWLTMNFMTTLESYYILEHEKKKQ